jgi:hypothetical protein
LVSSTLGELADERAAVGRAITALRLTPVIDEQLVVGGANHDATDGRRVLDPINGPAATTPGRAAARRRPYGQPRRRRRQQRLRIGLTP